MSGRSVGKKGWSGQGGGGAGAITNGNNLGAGAEVFAGLSGALSELMDFRTITGSNGIIVTEGADEINLSGAGIVGGVVPAVQSMVEGTGDNPNATLINETYYAACIPWGDGQINAIQIWVEVLGGTPTAFDAAIYDENGTFLVGKAVPQAPASVGSFLITLDSTINVQRNKKIWVAIAGSNGSNTQLNADNNSTNTASWNRYVTAQATIPAGNLPAGVITARRYWFRCIKV